MTPDRRAVRNAIVLALQAGPLAKAQIRDRVHVDSDQLKADLQHLRHVGVIQRIGQKAGATWALAGYVKPPKPNAKPQPGKKLAASRPFADTAVRRAPKPPETSWWTEAAYQDRAAFTAQILTRERERQASRSAPDRGTRVDGQ